MSYHYTLAEADRFLKNLLEENENSSTSPSERREYIRMALSSVEAFLHRFEIGNDYFLTSKPLEFDEAKSLFYAPSDIYGKKIRGIICVKPPQQSSYEVQRSRRRGKIFSLSDEYRADQYDVLSQYYCYVPWNESNRKDLEKSSRAIKLVPVFKSSEMKQLLDSKQMRFDCYYTRQVMIPYNDDDILEIPEFSDVVLKMSGVLIAIKQRDDSLIERIGMLYDESRKNMISTLEVMVPDDDNQILPDTSGLADQMGEDNGRLNYNYGNYNRNRIG